MAKKAPKKRNFYDYSLVFIIVILVVFGLVMIYSASSYTAQIKFQDPAYFMKRQAVIAALGIGGMILISIFDYHWLLKFTWLAYGASLVLVLLVFSPLGVELNGRKRWLGIGPVQFQPSEFAKIAVIMLLAVLICNMGREINTWKGLIRLAVIILPVDLLVASTNLSAGIIIAGICVVVTFVATDKKLIYFLFIAAIILGISMAEPIARTLNQAGILKDYQLARIMVWLDPAAYPLDGGYQVLQGLYAIGSGGITGKGLGESIQKLGFVPEAQNDMIFAIICEELGLFGAISVILMFMFLLWRFLVIANSAPDLYGALLVVGVMAHIAIQLILNIAVVSNVIPNTGITLPFISYGGTSVFLLLCEMGLVLSVSGQIRLDL